jgi:hypothetical protein
MGKVAKRNAKFGIGRQKMALERWTNPKPQRRTRSPRYGVPSCRGQSAGVAKRPVSDPPPEIPNVTIRNFCEDRRKGTALTLTMSPTVEGSSATRSCSSYGPKVVRVPAEGHCTHLDDEPHRGGVQRHQVVQLVRPEGG